MDNIKGILKFVNLLNDYRNVKRAILVNGDDRWENDVEHSYQLAMLAWYIIDSKKLNLDINLVLKYALVHDLVEVYAGDTYFYETDEEVLNSKDQREDEARKKLKVEYGEFGDLHDLITSYEDRKDAESKFVYTLDKLQPVLNIYLDGGRTWKDKKVTFDMLYQNKKTKISMDKDVKKYFDELAEILEDNKEELFFE